MGSNFSAAVHELAIDEAVVNLCRALGRDLPWIKRPWVTRSSRARDRREEAPVLELPNTCTTRTNYGVGLYVNLAPPLHYATGLKNPQTSSTRKRIHNGL